MLSTPPAFILSQDRTLIKRSLLRKAYKLLRNLSLLKLTKVVCLVSFKLTSFNSFTKTYCLGSCIFRYSQDSLMNHFKILKEFQGCLSIQLSKIYFSNPVFICVSSLVCYRLPRRLVYNIKVIISCQQLF